MSSSKKRYTIVHVDSPTKFIFAKALPTQKTAVVIEFLHETFLKNGFPKMTQTDQGTNFASREFNEYVEEARI